MATTTSRYQPPKCVDKEHKAEIKEIGKKLEKLRLKTGLSVFAYCKKIGIARNSYAKMEKGEIYFSLRNLMIILDHHGLNLKKFIQTDTENL